MDDCPLRQTPYGDPGDLDVTALPGDPRRLTEMVRGLILHRLEGGRFGHAVPEVLLSRDGWEPWDGTGAALTEDDLALLDAVAAAGTADERLRLHAHPRLAVPREVLSRAPFLGLRTVTLPAPSTPPV